MDKKRLLQILFAWVITAFGQAAWIPFFGVAAYFFGFGLFWQAIKDLSKVKRFTYGTVFFALIEAVQLSWMTSTEYLSPLILIVYLALIICLGVQFGLVTLLVYDNIFGAIAIWTLFEWSRLFILSGFSWNPVGLYLANSNYSIQFASIGGVYFLSFWVMLVNGFFIRNKRVWIILGLIPYVFGFFNEKLQKCLDSGKLNVALASTSFLPEEKNFSPVEQLRRVLINLKDNINTRVDLIVLPEASLPFLAEGGSYPFEEVFSLWGSIFEEKLPLSRRELVSNADLVQLIANRYNAEVVIGLEHIEDLKNQNAAFHFRPGAQVHEKYVKRILVPIGEYIPFEWAIPLAKRFGIAAFFTPGREDKVFYGKVPFSISICYEETYNYVIRKSRALGASLFINITNDVWFPNSKLARQHFEHGRIRAVENGVFLLRSCNFGVSGIVDCFGKIVGKESRETFLCCSIDCRSYKTLYTFWGNNFVLTICFLSLMSYFVLLKKLRLVNFYPN